MIALLLALVQATSPIQGTVRAEGSLEPIPYAVVEVVGTDRRAAADVRGFFTITGVPEGRVTIRARALGYTPVSRTVDVAGAPLRVEFVLVRLPVTIEAVHVDASTTEREVEATGPPSIRLDAATLQVTPALAEVDVLRALQMLPSVQQASDFSAALYVRGGSPDQTMVMLDGMPLFNPYHLGGIFAAIDPDAVAALDMWPGAMPARAGDRLSGIVQIWTREGGRDRMRSRGSIGLISSRASVDGPLPGGDGSFLFSARRTYLDAFTKAAKSAGMISEELPYHFTDAHLKLVHDVGGMGRLSVSGYYNEEQFHNRDAFNDAYDDDFDWGSRAVSIDWRQPMGGRFLLEARAGFSAFGSEIGVFDPPQGVRDEGPPVQTMLGRTWMRDALASVGLTSYLRSHELRAGVQLDAYRLEYEIAMAEDDFFADLLPEFHQHDVLASVAAFVEDDWHVRDGLSVRAGVRTLQSGGSLAVMPRAGASWRVSPRLTLDAGGGYYAQTLNSFRNEESILASFLAYDVLTPSDSLGLARSQDVVLGGEWRDARTRVRIDLYGKRFTELPMPRVPADPFEAPLLEVEQMARATGSASGVDLLVRREWSDRRSVFASYALAFAERNVDGERFTPRFERRHTLDLIGSFPLTRRTTGATRMVAATGQPYTPVLGRALWFPPAWQPGTGEYGTPFGSTFVLGRHNSARLPGYLRLDLSARRTSTRRMFGREGTLTWSLNVLNVLNTKNVLAAQPDSYGGRPGGELQFLPQLPILPTLSLEWSF